MFYNLSQRGLAIAYLELGAMREPARGISEMLEPTSFHLFFVNHCWLVLSEFNMRWIHKYAHRRTDT